MNDNVAAAARLLGQAHTLLSQAVEMPDGENYLLKLADAMRHINDGRWLALEVLLMDGRPLSVEPVPADVPPETATQLPDGSVMTMRAGAL